MDPIAKTNASVSPPHHGAACLTRRFFGWCHAIRGLERSRLLRRLFGLLATMVLTTLGGYLAWRHTEWIHLIFPIQLLMLGAGIYFARATLKAIQQEFYQPLSNLRRWASEVRQGNLTTRMEPPPSGEFIGLARDINSVGDALEKLSAHMDAEVRRQTRRIAQKRHHLQVLYEVAASLGSPTRSSDPRAPLNTDEIGELVNRFLSTMRDILHAEAGAVHLFHGENDQLELVGSLGLDQAVLENERSVALTRCLCGEALKGGAVLYLNDLNYCRRWTEYPLVTNPELVMIAVPLQHRGQQVGVYNLFIHPSHLEARDELRELFTSIGRHLGMAIEKARLDQETRRLTIIQERTTLAHELHDSLAQSLASMRFQVSMLDDTLSKDGVEAAREEIAQLKDGLNDAYSELRELLAHFRAPISSRGLIPALEDWISSFRKRTGIHTLLQTEWESTRLPPEMEMQVLRIVQEALANVRKHSQANFVRVLVRCTPEGEYLVLVEDDGIGLSQPAFSGHPGEHIGQEIMQERSRYLNGDLRFESEPGEGTRVVLSFKYPADDSAPVVATHGEK